MASWATKSSATGVGNNSSGGDNKPNLKYIMSEQLATKIEFEEVVIAATDDEEEYLASVAYTVSTSEEAEAAATDSAERQAAVDMDELLLAMCLQEIELEEKRGTGAVQNTGNIQLSNTLYSRQNKVAVASEVHSSSWNEAQQAQYDVSEKSQEAQNVLYRTDPLLRSIAASAELSGLKGEETCSSTVVIFSLC